MRNTRSHEDSIISLLEMTKEETKNILGCGFNFFPSRYWSYPLKAERWESSRVLYLYFKEGRIYKTFIYRYYLGKLIRKRTDNVKNISIASIEDSI